MLWDQSDYCERDDARCSTLRYHPPVRVVKGSACRKSDSCVPVGILRRKYILKAENERTNERTNEQADCRLTGRCFPNEAPKRC